MKHTFDSVEIEMEHKEYEHSEDSHMLRVVTEHGYDTFDLTERQYHNTLALLTDSDTSK